MKGARGIHSRDLVLTLALACVPFAKATGWALSDGAIVSCSVNLLSTPDPQILISQGFKSYLKHSPGGSSPQIKLDLGSSVTVTMASVINHYKNENDSLRMGSSAFYITDDAAAT